MARFVTFLKYATVTLLVVAFMAFVFEASNRKARNHEQDLYNAVHGGNAALVDYCNEYFTITVFRECAANIEYLRAALDE